MALRTFSHSSFTPTQTADGANLADNTHMTLIGGSTTQRCRIEEIYMGGQAGASSVNAIVVALTHLKGVTLSLASGALDSVVDFAANALAVPVVAYNTATTKPQRSATQRFLSLSFNSFGGIVRWNASNTQIGPVTVGNAIDGGEMTLSGANVGTAGLMSAHIIYEPY